MSKSTSNSANMISCVGSTYHVCYVSLSRARKMVCCGQVILALLNVFSLQCLAATDLLVVGGARGLYELSPPDACFSSRKPPLIPHMHARPDNSRLAKCLLRQLLLWCQHCNTEMMEK